MSLQVHKINKFTFHVSPKNLLKIERRGSFDYEEKRFEKNKQISNSRLLRIVETWDCRLSIRIHPIIAHLRFQWKMLPETKIRLYNSKN